MLSTLRFETSCDQCGRGLLVDADGDKYCLDCTRWTIVSEPPFVACVGSEAFEEATSLDALLDVLAEILDDKGPDDVAIWHGTQLVLVLHSNGRVSDFRPVAEPVLVESLN